MELVVHGTKGGYRTLYSTPGAPAIANDIRNNVSSENALGETLYAVSFAAGGCVFTKYRMVRDSLRGYATGTVAFSLFLPASEKMEGTDIKTLLDQLLSHYAGHYIKDNNVNRGETTQIIQEDWTFVDNIITGYKNKLKSNDDALQSGSKDAAFVYYNNEEELQRYFDDPFQEEYRDYKQIFFVSKELKDSPKNPLNALRHSEKDLTGKIDLNNPKYRLSYSGSQKVEVKVKVNGESQSLNCKVRRKSQLEITWSKPHYKKETKSGKCNEIGDEYITVNDNDQTVRIKEIELQPEIRKLTLNIVDTKGKPVTDAKITRTNNYSGSPKIESSNCIEFKGKEIGETWNIDVSAKNYEQNSFRYQPGNTDEQKKIELKKQIKIEILVFDKNTEKNITNSCKIVVYRGNRTNKPRVPSNDLHSFAFTGDEINEKWDVQIESNGYETNYDKKITPKSEVSPVKIELEKRKQDTPTCPNNGSQNNTNNTGSFNAEEQGRSHNHRSYSSKTIKKLSAIVAIAGTILWFTKGTIEMPPVSIEYTEGNELLMEKLDQLKTSHDEEKPKESDSNILDILVDIFRSEKKQASISPEYKKWQADSTKIAYAINLRNLINECDFEELQKQNYDYSEQQEPFKKAVNNIDSLQYDIVINRLRDVSKLTLDQIADSINVILVQIYPQGDKLCSEELNRLKNLHDEKRPDSASSEYYEYYEEWKADSTKIASAINLRKLINEHNFEELRKKQDYSQQQQKFKEAVNKIDPSQDKVVKEKLGDVSELTLIQIADSIDVILPQIKLQTKKSGTVGAKTIARTANNDTSINSLEVELKSNIITVERLKKLKQENPSNKSIQLYLDFWSKVKSSNQKDEFGALLTQVGSDQILKNSELQRFLYEICFDSEAFKKYKDARGKESCTSLEDLKKIIK